MPSQSPWTMPWGRLAQLMPRWSETLRQSKAGCAPRKDCLTPTLLTFWSHRAFESDEGARGGQGDEPVFVEGKLVGLAPEFVEMGGEPVGVFADHFGEAFVAAAVGAAEAVGGRAAAGTGDGGDQRDAVVKGAGDQGGFSAAGDAGDDELVFVDRGIGLR